MEYYVYILYSPNRDQYYVGQTGNLEDRLKRHNEGRSKATRGGEPWILKYAKCFPSRGEAKRRELSIKRKKSRKYIERLIEEKRNE